MCTNKLFKAFMAMSIICVILLSMNTSTSCLVKEKNKILVLLPTSTNKFWQAVRDGAIKAGTELSGKFEVLIRTGEEDTDAAGQESLLRGFLAEPDVVALVIGPASASAPAPMVAEYIKAGKKVVVIDSALDQDILDKLNVHVDATIVSDNELGGELAGKELVRKLGAGEHRIIMVEGDPVHESARARKSGFQKTIPTSYIVDYLPGSWRSDIARSSVADYLSIYNIEGLFAASDEMALGAIAAIVNKTELKDNWPIIIGYDATIEGLKEISSGRMWASVKQDAEGLGERGVLTAAGIIEGEIKPDKEGLFIKLEVRLIHR